MTFKSLVYLLALSLVVKLLSIHQFTALAGKSDYKTNCKGNVANEKCAEDEAKVCKAYRETYHELMGKSYATKQNDLVDEHLEQAHNDVKEFIGPKLIDDMKNNEYDKYIQECPRILLNNPRNINNTQKTIVLVWEDADMEICHLDTSAADQTVDENVGENDYYKSKKTRAGFKIGKEALQGLGGLGGLKTMRASEELRTEHTDTIELDANEVKGLITVYYCVRCNSADSFKRFVQVVQRKYPNVEIEGIEYETETIWYTLGHIASVCMIFLSIVIYMRMDVFNIIGWEIPMWWHFILSKYIFFALTLFVIGSLTERLIVPLDVFEIYLDGLPVWSKLYAGRLPYIEELFNLIEEVAKYKLQTINKH